MNVADSDKEFSIWFDDGVQNKSGRTAIWGDSFAICQLRQRASSYTPTNYYYYYFIIISYKLSIYNI